MKSIRSTLALSLTLCAAVSAVSYGQDESKDGPAAAAPKPEDKPAEGGAAAEAASNQKAREILKAAAEWQNAGDLERPGQLQSFHVVFSHAKFEREKTNAKGETSTQEVDTDDDGLVVAWMQGSIRSQISVHGNTTTKAYYKPRDFAWISDGAKTSSLSGSDRKTDLDELMFHRKVIDQLLDVAFLGKLHRDESRWKLLEDASRPGTVAIQRVPTENALDIVRITLWIADDGKGGYGDVVAAEMPPTAGGPTLHYELKYDEGRALPTVHRTKTDAESQQPVLEKVEMRFPWVVEVFEQRPGSAERRPVLKVTTKEISVNTVVDADFEQPLPKKR
jgi:hypothetical protein